MLDQEESLWLHGAGKGQFFSQGSRKHDLDLRRKNVKGKYGNSKSKNKEQLIRIEGEIALLKQNTNDSWKPSCRSRVSRMEKVMWSICLIAVRIYSTPFLTKFAFIQFA